MDVRELGVTPATAADGRAGERSRRAKRVLLFRRSVLALMAAFAAWHAAAIYFVVAPETALRDAVPYEALQAYARPMFQQGWSVFAPNPIRGDYVLWVRAQVQGDGEEAEVTDWINATEAEYALSSGNPAQPRAAIVSTFLSREFYRTHYELSEAQRRITTESFSDGTDWAMKLRIRLEEDGGSTSQLRAYLRQEWQAVAYATQVSKALWGEDVVRVQYRVAERIPVPFASRHDPEAKPTAGTIDTGWRRSYEPEGVNSAAFADVFLPAYELSAAKEREQ